MEPSMTAYTTQLTPHDSWNFNPTATGAGFTTLDPGASYVTIINTYNGTIFDQLESSANAPCTSTTFFAAPAEPPYAIVAPPKEYERTAYTTAIATMSVRMGPSWKFTAGVTNASRTIWLFLSVFASNWPLVFACRYTICKSCQVRGADAHAECAAEAVFLGQC
jgi:hypothetical protein